MVPAPEPTMKRSRPLLTDAEALGAELFGDCDLERATLAREAFAFLLRRGTTEIKVRVRNAGGDGGLTVIETLAPDAGLLVESVLSTLYQAGIEPVFMAHPILRVRRNGSGQITQARGARESHESFIHIQAARLQGDTSHARIEQEIRLAMEDAQAIERDRLVMWQRVSESIAARQAAGLSEEAEEARQFLEWLVAGNFVIMGVRSYRHIGDDAGGRLEGVYDTGLGILREPSRGVLLDPANPHAYSQEYRAFLHDRSPIVIGKSSARSRVGRRVEMDYVAARIPDGSGTVRGELKILGLFAPDVYTAPIRDIPILRRHVQDAISRSGFDLHAHAGRTLTRIIEEYPRDELFQMDSADILRRALEILPLYSLPRVKAILRLDRFARFASVTIFVPRDRYDSELRKRIGQFLEQELQGDITDFTPAFPFGAALARVRFLITLGGSTPTISEAEIESEVYRLTRTWPEKLLEELHREGEREGALRSSRYESAFGAGYREDFSARDAIEDIRNVELALRTDRTIFRLYPKSGSRMGLKIYARGAPMALSLRVPMLDGMGFLVVSERTYEVVPDGGEHVWLHDMTLERARGGDIDSATVPLLQDLLVRVSSGDTESDLFNALVLEAALPARDVALLRALSRYLHQIGDPFSQEYLGQVLVRHAAIAADVVRLFHARFDPAIGDDGRISRQAEINDRIETQLASVESLDEDRILRRFQNLVGAAVRTNFFQKDENGCERPAIALKFRGAAVDGLPEPRPLFEIFVASPRVDGVHLRFGKVARGGLRWSDRIDDFRTEVLGLVKAQQVKNAVIVPVGAKGGFVAKRLPPSTERDAWLAEGTAAYRVFIGALLDVTDNIVDGTVVPPAMTVRHDDDDPYLVVAADKGTATFSDTANEIANERGFWLRDAFASGGSAGYDHKRMGITARGAWEAVKRHFRELGVDIQHVPFTAAGIGDMSGDVFGNGMLLSAQTRLVAAFDHRHIFLDPNPDPAASWRERKRLFDRPRSSWADYNAKLISEGGGVYSRSAKIIELSPEAAEMLRIGRTATPNEIIRAILTLDVDLLYFGGIGTYVRGSSESDTEVGDRINDPVRVAGKDLRARVIGEGANLGMTQRGRVEAALAGIRLNTDAIDNSAGVNASDYEVNIKIALAGPVSDGRLSMVERNTLLAAMTDDVASRVLANNHSQTLALSCALRRDRMEPDLHLRLMQVLEAEAGLDRSIEFLPDPATLDRRRLDGAGLTRPELAVLHAYAKNAFYRCLLDSDALDEEYFAAELAAYFPEAPGNAVMSAAIKDHPLRREIVATRLTNAIMDLGGPAFPIWVAGGMSGAGAVARCFTVVRDAFGVDDLVGAIHALDSNLDSDLQIDLYLRVQNFLATQTIAVLRDGVTETHLENAIARYRAAANEIRSTLEDIVPASARDALLQDITGLSQSGVPDALARELAMLGIVSTAIDVVALEQKSATDLRTASAAFLAALDQCGILELRDVASEIPIADRHERILRDQALASLTSAARSITIDALARGEAVEDRLGRSAGAADLRAAIRGARAAPSLVRLCVAANTLSGLAAG